MIYNKKGFSLIEIIVAVGIVLVLASIVLISVGEARKTARDSQRENDIKQIVLALRMYKEMNSEVPVSYGGIVIGEGGSLDNATSGLGPYLTAIMRGDPRGSTTDTKYEYVYDSVYTCNGIDYTVVYVKTMERESGGNWASVCGTYSGGTSPSTYGVIIGPAYYGMSA
ncbi:type II secretion system protein [Candidatus Kaiserbacteria bacterium]|nr:MAG: type II secretion system protein [Candidatus Kaiserbacteria bacterium]